jgi:Ectoine synthase
VAIPEKSIKPPLESDAKANPVPYEQRLRSHTERSILELGLDKVFWYENHLETVYCIEGEGIVEDLANGSAYAVKPGTLYALDKNDRHRLRVRSVCG